MGIAVPAQVGGWGSAVTAVKKGRMARIKECERYIPGETTLAGCERGLQGVHDMGGTLSTFIPEKRALGGVRENENLIAICV